MATKCRLCTGETPVYDNESIGTMVICFCNGNRYEIPDILMHLVFDHKFQPPEKFIRDVMESHIVPWFLCGRDRGDRHIVLKTPRKVARLSGPMSIGTVPDGFEKALTLVMVEALRQNPELVYPKLQEAV